MSSEEPSQREIKESINKLAKKMEQKIIEDSRKKIFAGFPVEEVTELDWHRREKEQQASYKDLMDEVAAQEVKDEIWQRATWEKRRQRPIRQAEEYLASCSDEKDAESCAFWKARREKLFEEHMERARVLAEADAAYICKRSLPQDPDLLNFVEMSPQEVHNEWLDSEEAKVRERVNALFPPYMVDEISFAPGSINGLIRLDKHLDDIRVLSDLRHNHMLEIHHLKVTNRVLTILLIFSTAFGITAALAWLRCQ